VCANVGAHQGVLFLIDPNAPPRVQQVLPLVLLNNNYYYFSASSFGLNVGAFQLMFSWTSREFGFSWFEPLVAPQIMFLSCSCSLVDTTLLMFLLL